MILKICSHVDLSGSWVLLGPKEWFVLLTCLFVNLFSEEKGIHCKTWAYDYMFPSTFYKLKSVQLITLQGCLATCRTLLYSFESLSILIKAKLRMFLLWYFLLVVGWLFYLFVCFCPEEGNPEFILFHVDFFVAFSLILHFGVNLSGL